MGRSTHPIHPIRPILNRETVRIHGSGWFVCPTHLTFSDLGEYGSRPTNPWVESQFLEAAAASSLALASEAPPHRCQLGEALRHIQVSATGGAAASQFAVMDSRNSSSTRSIFPPDLGRVEERCCELLLDLDRVADRCREEAATVERSAGLSSRMGMERHPELLSHPRRHIDASGPRSATVATSDTEEAATHPIAATIPTFQSAKEGSLRIGTSERSKSSQKSLQRQSHTFKAAEVKNTKKRKVAHASIEDEALSPRSLSMSKKAMSKKIVDRAVSVSREIVARRKKMKGNVISATWESARSKKINEQAMSTEDGTLSPENEGQMDNHSSSPVIEMPTIAQKIRRNRSTTSEVWNHFLEPDEDNPIAVCKYCGKQYMCKSFHGTSNLWKHLRFQCPAAPLKDQDTRKKEHGTPKQCYSYDECRRSLVEMIIVDEMAFRAVEGQGFLKYSHTLQPKFEVPSRTTVARDAMQMFLEEKEKMKKILRKQRISLTTDTWSSNQNINYMCLTAHWIDDSWHLQRRVINFCLVDDHKGKTIGKKIEECLLEWGVDRIFTITVDNASSNDGAISYIKDLSKNWEGTVLQHEFIHMRCCAHIVNLIVKNGLGVTNNSIDKIRIAVRFVRSSPSRLQQFKKCAEKEKISRKRLLSLDVDTRWNATYLMLENAIIFEKAFARLNKENKEFKTYFVNQLPPNETDWFNARRCLHFLKVFYKVTVRLSGSLHVTSASFFHEFVLMYSKLNELARHSDPFIAEMSNRMKIKFSKYWEDKEDLNNLLFIALILDPRYKMKYLSFFFLGIYGPAKQKEVVGKIESDLRRLFECYVEFAASSSYPTNYNQPPLQIDVDEHEENPSFLLASQFTMHLEEIEYRESNSELSRYLAENCEKITDDFDILLWWKCNTNKYPILSKLAKDVLAVPVSTVASESTFSSGGRIIDSFRTSLSASTVEALICTQSWLRSPPDVVDLRKYVEEIQAYEEIEEDEQMLRGKGAIQKL